MNYEKTKERLSKLAQIAPFGSHVRVADAVGISEAYCKKIRIGNGAKRDSEDNRELIESMIEAYEYEINEQRDLINKTL